MTHFACTKLNARLSVASCAANHLREARAGHMRQARLDVIGPCTDCRIGAHHAKAGAPHPSVQLVQLTAHASTPIAKATPVEVPIVAGVLSPEVERRAKAPKVKAPKAPRVPKARERREPVRQQMTPEVEAVFARVRAEREALAARGVVQRPYYSLDVIRALVALAEAGWPLLTLSQATGISTHALADWRRGKVPTCREAGARQRSGTPLEVRIAALRAVENGRSIESIAREIGVSAQAVRHWRDRARRAA